jgi:two-component system nitrogen regulation response regulator GlnG
LAVGGASAWTAEPALAADEGPADGEHGYGAQTAGTARAGVSPDELLGALRRHGWRTGAAAAALRISKTTLYALMERTPGVRKARDLTAGEIAAAEAEAGGDLDRMAEVLQVSRRGLVLRMGELAREGGRGRR